MTQPTYSAYASAPIYIVQSSTLLTHLFSRPTAPPSVMPHNTQPSPSSPNRARATTPVASSQSSQKLRRGNRDRFSTWRKAVAGEFCSLVNCINEYKLEAVWVKIKLLPMVKTKRTMPEFAPVVAKRLKTVLIETKRLSRQ